MILWLENKELTPLHRVFLWNNLEYNSTSFNIFGIDAAIDNAVGFITLNQNEQDKVRLHAQNELRSKIDKILKKKDKKDGKDKKNGKEGNDGKDGEEIKDGKIT